jgi:hypothetical protein
MLLLWSVMSSGCSGMKIWFYEPDIVLRTRQRQQLDKEAIRKARTVRDLGVKANYLIALHTAEASSPVEPWEWNHELQLQLMQQAVGHFWFEWVFAESD